MQTLAKAGAWIAVDMNVGRIFCEAGANMTVGGARNSRINMLHSNLLPSAVQAVLGTARSHVLRTPRGTMEVTKPFLDSELNSRVEAMKSSSVDERNEAIASLEALQITTAPWSKHTGNPYYEKARVATVTHYSAKGRKEIYRTITGEISC